MYNIWVQTLWCSHISIGLRSIKAVDTLWYISNTNHFRLVWEPMGRAMDDREISKPAGLELYFTQLHLMYSFQNTLFGNVTSTANSQHLQPQQTRHLVVYQLVFSHQQPRGHQQHNPPKVRDSAETRTKSPAVLREETDFFLLACFGHSMMVIPGYIKKNAPICYAD